MGVLVFVMAILPMSDGHTMHILRAEMPGPTAGKLVSRMSDTAKILYGMYFVMTIVMIVLLLLGGMDLFDASVHAFGTAGTGGFSSRNASVGPTTARISTSSPVSGCWPSASTSICTIFC